MLHDASMDTYTPPDTLQLEAAKRIQWLLWLAAKLRSDPKAFHVLAAADELQAIAEGVHVQEPAG